MSLAGTAHFAISAFFWVMAVYLLTEKLTHTSTLEWKQLLYAVPAFVLLTLFAASSFRAWRRRKGARTLLAAAVVLAVASFVFDAVNRNYQMHVEWKMADSPPPCIYFTWWWYDERWLRLEGLFYQRAQQRLPAKEDAALYCAGGRGDGK